MVKMTVPKVDPKDEPPARQAGSESGQERSQAHSVQVSPQLEAQGWLPQAELQRELRRREEPQPPVESLGAPQPARAASAQQVSARQGLPCSLPAPEPEPRASVAPLRVRLVQ